MAEAARRKGCNYRTVVRAVGRGRLPARRLGSSWLIAEADLAAWEPKWAVAPRESRRVLDPAAGPAIPDAAPLERAALEAQVVLLATALAAELPEGELRALAERLAARLAETRSGTG